MVILRIRITGLNDLHVSPTEGLDEILSFEDISPLRIHEYKPAWKELLHGYENFYNHSREATKMMEETERKRNCMKQKTYCEKWPVGCRFCDLLLCDGKKDKYEITTMDKSGIPSEVLTFEYVHPCVPCKPTQPECGECEFANPQTNYDRIISKTTEELAEWVTTKGRTFGEEYEGYMSLLDWLKSPEVDK